MERYSRLGQFFNSPDKTLSELYSCSPYTTSFTDSSEPTGTPSLASNVDNFPASDVSQESYVDQTPLNRKSVFDDPPSRLHLKRRSKAKEEQDRNEENNKLTSEYRQNYLNVSQWNKQPWKGSYTDCTLEQTRRTTQTTNTPPRPLSSHKENKESEYSSYRSNENRNCCDRNTVRQNDKERSVEEKNTVNRYNQNQENCNRSNLSQSSNDRLNRDRVSTDRGNNLKGRNDRTSSDRGSSDRDRRDSCDRDNKNATNSEKNARDHGCGVRDINYRYGDRDNNNRPNSNRRKHDSGGSNDRGSQERHRQDIMKKTHTSRESPDSTLRRRRSLERPPGANTTQVKTTQNSWSRPQSASEERTKLEVIHRSPEKYTPAKEEPFLSVPQTYKTIELFQNTAAFLRPKCDSPQGPNGVPKRSTTESPHRSALSGTRQELEEPHHGTKKKLTEANTGVERLPEKRYLSSNFTIPRSLTFSAEHLRTVLLCGKYTTLDDEFQETASGRLSEDASQKAQQKNSQRESNNTSPGILVRSNSESNEGKTRVPPSIFSRGSTNGSHPSSEAKSPVHSPTRSSYGSQQLFTSQSHQDPKLSALPGSSSYFRQGVSCNPKETTKEFTPGPKSCQKIKDTLDRTRNLLVENGNKYNSPQERRPFGIPTEEIKFTQRKSEAPSYTSDQEKRRVYPWLDACSNFTTTKQADHAIQNNLTPNKSQNALYSPQLVNENTKSDVTKMEVGQPGVNGVAIVKCSDMKRTGGSNSTSWRTSSSSDVTEGESILDIETFKQTIMSAELPQELLEPLEESEESENILNILETISESPLEDCSQLQNSSESLEEVTNNSQVSENTPQRRVSRHNTVGDHTDNSASDLSDIQLHYAYGRNEKDQLELKWIKLEKVIDSASESSKGSIVESPFNHLEKSTDLEIRSVNLPNASVAQRHGDADRGPIATYLTLPTQSPTSEEDPELAIIVLHEDNLSEHQKQVVSRFRTGMKRQRSRISSQVKDHSSDNLTVQDQTEQPLIIPISDPNSDGGSTTGFAVIANSEPEVPLSVDVDIKSWLSNQHVQGNEPPILVTRCHSKGPLDCSRESYSEILKENTQHESSRFDSNTTKFSHRNTSDSSKDGLRQDSKVGCKQNSDTCRYTFERKEILAEHPPSERPKSALICNDSTKPIGIMTNQQQESNDQKLQLKTQLQEMSETFPMPSHRAADNSQKTPQTSADHSYQRASSPQKSSIECSRTLKSSLPEKRAGNEQPQFSSSNNKYEAMNKLDDTVEVLFEQKFRSTRESKEKPRKSENLHRVQFSNNTPKPEETNERRFSSPVRMKTFNGTSKQMSEKSQVIEKSQVTEKAKPPRSKSQEAARPKLPERPIQKNRERPPLKIIERPTSKTPERPRTAPPGSERSRLRGLRGLEITKETRKPQENRVNKHSLSVFVPPTHKNSNDLPRGEPNTINESRGTSEIRTSRIPTATENHRQRPQTFSPVTTERFRSNIESVPVNESYESSLSTDSGGVPHYILKRNISYLSEYRKTIDSLRAKCVMKDHMIDVLLDEIQLLSPTEESYKRLFVKLSSCNVNGLPPRRDYTCSELADIFPKDREEAAYDKKRSTSRDEAAVQCVCPSDFRVAGKVGCDCVLLTWKSAPENDTVAGYEVDVDGRLIQRVRSPTRTSALLMDLDLSRAMRFTLRTLRRVGNQACHPPLDIVFTPSGDDWVLDDLALSAGAAKSH